MSTAATDAMGIKMDLKTITVKVRSAATVKLDYLRVLVSKIATAAQKNAYKLTGFVQRFWDYVPAALSGLGMSGVTSTSAGYRSAILTTSVGLNLLKGITFKALHLINGIIDKTIGLAALIVRAFNAPLGEKIRNKNAELFDKTESLIEKIEKFDDNNTVSFYDKFTSKITTRIVNVGSLTITALIVANYITKGKVLLYSILTPVIGSQLNTALTALFSSQAIVLASIAALALIGVCVSEISDRMFARRITKAFAADQAKINEQNIETAFDAFVETYDSDPEPEISSLIVANEAGEVSVKVTGNVSEEVAKLIAEKHVEVEINELEKIVHKNNSQKTNKANKKR